GGTCGGTDEWNPHRARCGDSLTISAPSGAHDARPVSQGEIAGSKISKHGGKGNGGSDRTLAAAPGQAGTDASLLLAAGVAQSVPLGFRRTSATWFGAPAAQNPAGRRRADSLAAGRLEADGPIRSKSVFSNVFPSHSGKP